MFRIPPVLRSKRVLLLIAAVVGLVALVMLYVYWPGRQGRREGLAGRSLLPIGSTCQYAQRIQTTKGDWACPANTVDTGRTWGDNDGDKQCLMGCVTNPNVCSFKYRQYNPKDGSWKCPAGYADTGMNNGVPDGERQCQQCGFNGTCRYTQRTQTSEGVWRCPVGTIDTGAQWADGTNGDKQCITACCPSGFKGKNGGSSDLFPCGPWDIQREGGIRNSSNQKAEELIGACCQWTNKDCRKRGFAGFFQSQVDKGIVKTGFYTADDGCEVNVYDQRGGEIAVTGTGLGIKGLGIQIGMALAVTAISVGAAAFMGPAGGVLAAGVGGTAIKLVANQAAKKVTKQVVNQAGTKVTDREKEKMNQKAKGKKK